jgi:hypothetical protein
VTGHVADSTGAVMPKVSIQLTNVATNEAAVTVTNNQSVYSLPLV